MDGGICENMEREGVKDKTRIFFSNPSRNPSLLHKFVLNEQKLVVCPKEIDFK